MYEKTIQVLLLFMNTRPTDFYALLEEKYNPLIVGVTKLLKPIICAVNGVTAGESSSFIHSFNRLGFAPDLVGSWTLPR